MNFYIYAYLDPRKPGKYCVQVQTIKSIEKGRTWKQVHKFFTGGDSVE